MSTLGIAAQSWQDGDDRPQALHLTDPAKAEAAQVVSEPVRVASTKPSAFLAAQPSGLARIASAAIDN